MAKNVNQSPEAAVANDEALEAGVWPIGKPVWLCTPKFAFSGNLDAVLPDVFVLSSVRIVNNTGHLHEYTRTGNATNASAEPLAHRIVIERGGCVMTQIKKV